VEKGGGALAYAAWASRCRQCAHGGRHKWGGLWKLEKDTSCLAGSRRLCRRMESGERTHAKKGARLASEGGTALPSATATQSRQAQRGRRKGVTQQDAAKRASAECGTRVDTQRAAAERVQLYKERVAGLGRDELGAGEGRVRCLRGARAGSGARGPTAASSHPCRDSHTSGSPHSGPPLGKQGCARCGGVSGGINGATANFSESFPYKIGSPWKGSPELCFGRI
jgi:hypothetical protein